MSFMTHWGRFNADSAKINGNSCAWRKYRNRERNITSPVDVPINAAYAIGKLRAACNEHHVDIGDAIMVLATQLGQSDDKNNLILGEIRAFRRVMDKTGNS